MSINEPTSADAKRGKWVKYCIVFVTHLRTISQYYLSQSFKWFCLKKLFDQLDQNTPRINQLNL